VRALRTSARKLNLVAQSIRGLKVQRRLNELEFSHKRIARDVARRSTRRSPTPRTTTTSTSTPGRRRGLRGQEPGDEAFRGPRRGRASRIEKPFCEITIVVREAG
jgi:large subunit ribosomal protein L22